jgi:[ribosomal protein S5]-alanine N-acetyltransferase
MAKEFPIIETNRLLLRKVTKVDANQMFTYLSDKEVVKHMGLEPFQTLNDVYDEINWYQSIHDEGSGIRWGITLKDSESMR